MHINTSKANHEFFCIPIWTSTKSQYQYKITKYTKLVLLKVTCWILFYLENKTHGRVYPQRRLARYYTSVGIIQKSIVTGLIDLFIFIITFSCNRLLDSIMAFPYMQQFKLINSSNLHVLVNLNFCCNKMEIQKKLLNGIRIIYI